MFERNSKLNMADLNKRRLNLKFPVEVIEMCHGLQDTHQPLMFSAITEKDEMVLCVEKKEGYVMFAFSNKNSFVMKSTRAKKSKTDGVIDVLITSIEKVSAPVKNKKKCTSTSDSWKCDIRHEKFKIKNIHQRTKHKKSRTFLCNICEAVSFSSSKSLSRHLYVKHRREVTTENRDQSSKCSLEHEDNEACISLKEETNSHAFSEENELNGENQTFNAFYDENDKHSNTVTGTSEYNGGSIVNAPDMESDSTDELFTQSGSIKCSKLDADKVSENYADNSNEVNKSNEECEENLVDAEIMTHTEEKKDINQDLSINCSKPRCYNRLKCNELGEGKSITINNHEMQSNQSAKKGPNIKSSKSIRDLQKCNNSSSNSPKLVCCDCSNTGRNPDAVTLALHVLYNHKDESLYEKVVNYFDFLQFEGKKVKCTKCEYNYVSDTKSGIRNHLINQHKVDIDFSTVESYLRESYQQRNLKSEHRKAADGKLQCKICKIFYSSYKAVYKHFMKCHKKSEMSDLLKDIKGQKQKARQNGWYEKDKKVTCHECGFSFKVGKGITHHIKLLHKNNHDLKAQAELSEKYGPFYAENVSTYCCKLCDEDCSLKTILQHLKQQHATEPKYSETLEFYTERIQHYSHITKHVSRNSVYTNKIKLCIFCQKVLSTANFNKHIKTCKLNPDRIQFYHCYCGYRTESKDKHALHKSRCDKQVPETLYCEICGLACSSRATLCSHRREKHQVGIQKPVVCYTCSKCDKSFWRKQSYMKHTLIHSLTKDHICETCGKAFRTPSDLKKHQDTQHDNKFRYRCSKCGHGMEKEKYLKTHVCSRVRRKQSTNFTAIQSLPVSTATTIKPADHVTSADSITETPKELLGIIPQPVVSDINSENITSSGNFTNLLNISSTKRLDNINTNTAELSDIGSLKLDSISTSSVNLTDISGNVPRLITIHSSPSAVDSSNAKLISINSSGVANVDKMTKKLVAINSSSDLIHMKNAHRDLSELNIQSPNLVRSNSGLSINSSIPNMVNNSTTNIDSTTLAACSSAIQAYQHHLPSNSNTLVIASATNATIPATTYSVNEHSTSQNPPQTMDILQSVYTVSEIVKQPSISVVYNEQNQIQQPSFIQQIPQNVEYKLDIGNSVFNDILQAGDRTLLPNIQVVSNDEYYMENVNNVALAERNSSAGSPDTSY